MLIGLDALQNESTLMGALHYPGGALEGMTLGASDSSRPDSRMLSYDTYFTGALFDDESTAAILFRNGEYDGAERANGSAVLDDITGDAALAEIMLAPNDPQNNALWDGTTLFYVRPIGDRVKLTWTDIPDEADFDAFLIYYDAGLGGDVDTLLAELGRDEQEYITASLGAGTFVFRIAYRDSLGNVSEDLGETTSVTTATLPSAPTATGVYSQSTRKITVTFGDTEEVWVWANYSLATGRCDYVNLSEPFDVHRAGTTTWTSTELWEGDWELWFTKRDDYGRDSEPARVAFTLVKDAGVLKEVVEFGGPVRERAVLAADAAITVEWEWDGDVPQHGDPLEDSVVCEVQVRPPTDATLVGHWKMNDNAATVVVVDSAAGGNNGTFTDPTGNPNTSAHTTGGRVNTALTFDGVDDYVNCGTAAALLPAAWTVSAWVKPVERDWNALINWSATLYYPAIYLDVTNRPLIYMGTSNYRFFTTAVHATLVDGSWHHVVFICPGSAQSDISSSAMWMDGSPVSALTTLATGVQTAKTRLNIGGIYTTYRAQGSIDDVRLYNRVLSEAEIEDLYNAGQGHENETLWVQVAEAGAESGEQAYAGADGLEYEFRLRAKYDNGVVQAEGEFTDTIEATADGSGPVGDYALTAELIV